MTTENLGTLAGPALGGILLAATDVGLLFAVCAGVYLISAACAASRRGRAARHAGDGGARRELLGGFRALAREPGAAFIIGLFCAQTLVRGALQVFVVVASIQLLGIGESGVGFLTAALGAGGLFGAFFSLSLAGQRLASPFASGLVLWGLPIVVIGIWPEAAVALLMMAIGSGNSVLDVFGTDAAAAARSNRSSPACSASCGGSPWRWSGSARSSLPR